MPKYIDLSHPISHHMPVCPADPAVGVLLHHNNQDGYMVMHVIFGTHTGTHIDVPVQKLHHGKTVDEVPIERFAKRAFVMDLTDKRPGEEIRRDDLDRFSDEVLDVSAVILKTGWSKHFNEPDFFTSFPGLSEEAVEWLMEHNIDLVGLESPSVNASRHAEIHTLLLENDVLIVESLTNLDSITNKYVDFFAVPLKFKGLDGSPVRAFAVEHE